MEALHFGPAARPLFGLRHPAQGGTIRRTGIVICPAWGPEYMRGYRGVRLLATALARAGFEVLRFDYSGTGDSEGPSLDARLDHWLADIAAADAELAEVAGCTRVALLGVRLGALLVQEAVRRKLVRPPAVVTWDAPANGADFAALMKRQDEAADAEKNVSRPRAAQLPPHEAYELCGHAWPALLAEAVAGLPPLPDAPNLHWIASSDHSVRAPPSARVVPAGEPGHWEDPRWAGTPWLPSAGIARVVEVLAGVLP